MSIDWTGIALIAVLILFNAIFAASEIAVLTSRRVKVQQLQEQGNKSANALLRLMDDPSRFLATIQIGITLAGFLASATAAVGLSAVLEEIFISAGLPESLSKTLGVFGVTLIISYITLVLGELAPKRLAMQWSEKIALFLSRPINLLAKITAPLTKFLTFSTNIVVRLLGGDPHQNEKEITEDEIRIYIAEHRSLPEEEKRMIEAVFDFGDQVVRQVMVPRTEIVYLNADETIREAYDKICQCSHSAFPIYRKNYEEIVGIVRVQDLACHLLSNPEQKVDRIALPTLFIPETKHTVALLKEFRKKKIGMAIVVDEYGGISGLVTLEDLVDEIIGDVVEEEDFIRKNSEGQWIVEGDTPIQDIMEALEFKKNELDSDYETIAGFILEQLGHLPVEGETVSWKGYEFQVKEMGIRRINKVRISSPSKIETKMEQ